MDRSSRREVTRSPGEQAPESADRRLRRYIVEHGLQPGDRLPSEAELASRLGSSRVVVREALSALEALGIVEARVGAGWYVRDFSAQMVARTFAHSLAFHPNVLLDLMTVRSSIESELVITIADRIGPADLAALDELVENMTRRAARGEPFTEADGQFHRRLIAVEGNQVALALTDIFFSVMDILYQQGLPTPAREDLPMIALAHRQIVDALRRRDGQEARHAMILSNNDGRRRLAQWRDTHADDDSTHARRSLEMAVQSALLWPEKGVPAEQRQHDNPWRS